MNSGGLAAVLAVAVFTFTCVFFASTQKVKKAEKAEPTPMSAYVCDEDQLDMVRKRIDATCGSTTLRYVYQGREETIDRTVQYDQCAKDAVRAQCTKVSAECE